MKTSNWLVWLRRWLFEHEQQVQAAKLSTPQSPDQTGRRGCLEPGSFLQAAQEMAADESIKDLRLHILSLAEFHDAVADKWHRLSRLIVVAVAAIARQHLDPQRDIFTQFDTELSFLVIPSPSRATARTCVAAVARDVAGQLFGDAVINGRRPRVIVTNMPLRQALASDGSFDQKAILTAVAAAGAGMKGVGPPPVLSAPCRATLAALMQEKETALPASTDQSAPPDWFQTEIDAQAAAKPASDMNGESKLTLLWTPTWVTSQKTVGAFHARLVRSDGETAMPLEGCHAYESLNPVETLTLDRFVATQTAHELKDISYGGQHTGLVLPVHWLSLSPRWRDCIRLPLLDCPESARRRLLKVEVFGLSAAVPPRLFAYMFEPLQAMGCDVMVRLGLDQADVIPLLSGVKAVGLDLAELKEQDRVSDHDLSQRIEHFRATARTHHLASYIWGVRHRPLVERVLASGFSLINGPAIMCDLGHPSLVRVDEKQVA